MTALDIISINFQLRFGVHLRLFGQANVIIELELLFLRIF